MSSAAVMESVPVGNNNNNKSGSRKVKKVVKKKDGSGEVTTTTTETTTTTVSQQQATNGVNGYANGNGVHDARWTRGKIKLPLSEDDNVDTETINK